MLEVECKYRVADVGPVLAQLEAWGAALVADHAEADHYLNAPDRDFSQTDEALRLRQIGDKSWLTYKGPRLDTATKTRPEIEVPCADGDQTADAFLQLFDRLGYRRTAVVSKRRKIYEVDRAGFAVHICVDNVEQVGQFVEIEVLAPEADASRALATIAQVASELGLTEGETRSYLEQLLGHTVVPGGAK